MPTLNDDGEWFVFQAKDSSVLQVSENLHLSPTTRLINIDIIDHLFDTCRTP